MKYSLSSILILIIIFTSCAQTTKTEPVDTVFQDLLDSSAKSSTGVLLSVYAPKLAINWQGASGFDSKTKEYKLQPEQPFRIASITKTYTAVSILRLHEMGKLDINDPIISYISDAHKTILRQDNYDLNTITIKHCLQHTSGLFDYAVGSEDYVAIAIENPNKKWTRTEQVQFAIDHGEPVGKPGETYHYSDTGYILLGEIIERLTGKGLAEANQELIKFDALELSNTWLQSLEPEPKNIPRRVSSYLDGLDATNWHNSVDVYGGGGYVSTTEDLTKFYNHLFNNTIFDSPDTLKLMLSSNGITNQGRTAESYKMGLWEIKTPHGNGYMHNGFWGSAVIHFPDYNATIALYYVDSFNNNLMKGVFSEIVKQTKK